MEIGVQDGETVEHGRDRWKQVWWYGVTRKKCTNEFLMSLLFKSIYFTHTSLDSILD